MRVRLETLTAGHPLRDQVLGLAPHPHQERFSSRASLTLPAADADPGRTPFVVVTTDVGEPGDVGRAAGFGVLDRAGYLDEVLDDPRRAALLLGFYIDADMQGRGIGTQAARAVRGLAAGLDGVELVVLTVSVQNPAAVATYRRAGFVDTGAQYLGGDEGPQHLLVAAVGGRDAGRPSRSAQTC